ncbi:MAG: hypothetical protein FJ027_04520 [Candidatus Rokubacteria bacterium]|nr:hypothetical protein [Candidatus Rokubacteria bacterium]
MRSLALALTLTLGTTVAAAQSASDAGTILRIDPPSRVVVLEDGRMYRAVAGSSFRTDDRPVTFAGLRPGTRVVVESAEPVIYRQGRYIALPAVAPPAEVAITASATPVLPGPQHSVPGPLAPLSHR